MKKYSMPVGGNPMPMSQFRARWAKLIQLHRDDPQASLKQLAGRYFYATKHQITRQRVHQVLKRAGVK